MQNFKTIAPRIVFFFQAEDGILDWSVTGVQMCALPISGEPCRRPSSPGRAPRRSYRLRCGPADGDLVADDGVDPEHDLVVQDHVGGGDGIVDVLRSEERRVGKECRARGWSPDAKSH